MNRSPAKEPAAKRDLSASRSRKSTYSAKNLPKSRLNSLIGVTGSALSPDTIATRLSRLPPANRAPTLRVLQRTRGNRSVQRMAAGIQAKLIVGQPGDVYEQEADRVADEVMRMPEPQVQWQAEENEENKTLQTKPLVNQITPLIQREVEEEEMLQAKSREDATSEVTNDLESQIKGGGRPLAEFERAYFEPRFGTDFSQVKVHTGAQAAESAGAVNAKAYTLGHDVVFGGEQYAPGTAVGQRLLAHELTHVIQQQHSSNSTTINRYPRGALEEWTIAKGNKIEYKKVPPKPTGIGQILDAFFSESTTERIWIMDESDQYTDRVRQWKPVIKPLKGVKRDLEENCENCRQNHMTDPSWRPGPIDQPAGDENAWGRKGKGICVNNHLGTDPVTAGIAYIIYRSTGKQTDKLHTSAIGTFYLFITADEIDCTQRTSRLQVWMYNCMDQDSFGRFVEDFPESGMATQHMWWNWTEEHNWGSTPGSGGEHDGSGEYKNFVLGPN